MARKYQIKNCLIIEWLKMPEPLREEIKEWVGFGNDSLVPIRSEFSARSLRKGMAGIEEYYEDQRRTNGFEGSFGDFVEEYNLQFEIWFVEQNIDLENVDKILINVSW